MKLLQSTDKNSFTILAKWLRDIMKIPIRTRKQMIKHSGLDTIEGALTLFTGQYNNFVKVNHCNYFDLLKYN